MKYPAIFPIIFTALITTACSPRSSSSISEGEIHYKITYETEEFGLIPVEALPRTLVLMFKDNNTHLELASVIGGFKLTNITHYKNEMNDTYLRFFGLEYCYPGQPGEIPPGFEKMENMQVSPLDKTMEICGYNCRAYKVLLPDGTEFTVYATDELKVKKPNLSNPYKDIEGVLMSFYFIIGNVSMQLEAQAVYDKEVSDEHFLRQEEYKQVKREDMQRILDRMMQ